jgi:hypothetical protein
MSTPEGGTDPHRDDWVPVPLTLKTYDREAKTYVIEFKAPKQLLLNHEFEAMVHDEILRNADRDGLMLEGQIVVSHRDLDDQPVIEQDQVESPYQLSEGERMFRERITRQNAETIGMLFGGVPKPDVMVVRAEALVTMDTGVIGADIRERLTEESIADVLRNIEIPDDLSGLDED